MTVPLGDAGGCFPAAPVYVRLDSPRRDCAAKEAWTVTEWHCAVRDTDQVVRELCIRGARKPDARPN